MTEALSWWLVLVLVGALAFPIAYVFLSGLADRGYAFSKVLGLLIISYTLWIAGTAHVLPNGRLSIIFLLLALAGVSAGLAWRRRDDLLGFIRERAPYILWVEALFAAAFAVSLWLRSHVAGIHDIEKPSDFAMLNAVIRADSFPPADPWLSGSSVNYYYFGYVIHSVPIQLLDIPSSIGYNLALAGTLALGATAAFGVLYNLIDRDRAAGTRLPLPDLRAVGFGVLAVVFLFVLSNLMGVIEMLTVHGVGEPGDYGWLKLPGLDEPRETNTWYPIEHFWWLRAITFFTWSEFPFFSFLLGDLHPHVLAIPFTLLAIGVALGVLYGDGDRVREFWHHPAHLVLTSIIIGALGFILTWNMPVALLFLALAALLWSHQIDGRFTVSNLLRAGGYVLTVAAVALLVYAPFFFTLDIPTELAFTDGPTVRPIHLFIFWGTFLVITSFFAAFAIARHPDGWRPRPAHVGLAAALALLPLLAWSVSHLIASMGQDSLPLPAWAGGDLITSARTGDLPHYTWGWPTLVITNGVLFVVILAVVRHLAGAWDREDGVPLLFALSAAGMGMFLIMSPELFAVLDPLGLRVNTVIKSWYLAWMFLALSSAYGIYWMGKPWRPRRALSWAGTHAWLPIVVVFVLAGLVYPVIASYARTIDFSTQRTVDGLEFLRRGDPDEYAAIQWLASNADGSAVVMEAYGGDYTDFGRVSSRTGMPTVLGWLGHERQWRGPFDELEMRMNDIEVAYNTSSAQVAGHILEKYGVKYVYVGRLETQTYEPEGTNKFRQFMDVAYRNASVTIYEAREPAGATASTPP